MFNGNDNKDHSLLGLSATSKSSNFKESLIKLLNYSSKFKKVIIVSIIFAIVSSILSIIGPQYISEMTNVITDGLLGSIDMNKIWYLTIILVIIYGCSWLFGYIQSKMMAIMSQKYSEKLRSDFSKKINKLPLKYFDNHTVGDTLSIVTNDVDTIGQSLNQSLGQLVSASVLCIGACIMMFYTNLLMAVVAVVSSLLGFLIMSKILVSSQKYFNARQVELGRMNGHIEEIYTNHDIVRVYNGSKKEKKKFNKINQSLFTCDLKSQFLSGIMQPLMSFIGNFGYVCVCVVGALLAMNGSISFGVIVSFMVYIRLFTNPLSQISQSFTSLQSASAASERVFTFLASTEQEDETQIQNRLELNNTKGNIEFKNVKFGYNEDKIIINDFSCKVKSGAKIAIVGPTGAGKTTIVNLLMKFYNIGSGDITIDNVSIKDLTRENIHDLFIMVLQDTWLFNGTIRENVKYNNENVSDEEIMNAISQVGLEHFIKTLPNGLDTKLSDAESISVGQKQLLTIARGLIKNSPLLILDEATSSVDTRTEELVQKSMDKLTKGRTSFIIAHRLSTIKNADLILVMKDGNIIEQGTHDELIDKRGFYEKLYNSQFQN